MPPTRKTLDRQAFVNQLNAALASPNTSPDERKLLAAFAGGVLLTGNAYRGYGFQQSEWTWGGLRDNYDDTRRVYY